MYVEVRARKKRDCVRFVRRWTEGDLSQGRGGRTGRLCSTRGAASPALEVSASCALWDDRVSPPGFSFSCRGKDEWNSGNGTELEKLWAGERGARRSRGASRGRDRAPLDSSGLVLPAFMATNWSRGKLFMVVSWEIRSLIFNICISY